MIDALIPYLEKAAALAPTWGPLLVLLFMTIESSFIPFPSEVVMIPAGFLSARGEFFPAGNHWGALILAILLGVTGSLLGAFLNYWLSWKLGRPFLHRWGKYFFLPPPRLERAEEIFREYGDMTTFVCRLLPVIRQLISIPAGISGMHFGRFTFFTAAGAALWVVFLSGLGFWFGTHTREMTYAQLVHKGKDFVSAHLLWILLGALVLLAVYVWVHRRVVGGNKDQERRIPGGQ